LLMANLTGYIIWAYVSWCHRLIDPNTPKAEIRGINMSFLFVNLFYIVAMLLSLWNVYAGYAVFFAVLVYVILFRSDVRRVKA